MPAMYFLYSEKDRKWYVGCTRRSVEERLEDHVMGRVRSTKHRRPLSLAYYELYEDFPASERREWYLKNKQGVPEKQYLKNRLLDCRDQWPLLGPLKSEVGGPTGP